MTIVTRSSDDAISAIMIDFFEEKIHHEARNCPPGQIGGKVFARRKRARHLQLTKDFERNFLLQTAKKNIPGGMLKNRFVFFESLFHFIE